MRQITKRTEEQQAVQLYAGIGQFQFMAVNPTAAEIENLFGYKPEKEPVYVTKNDKGVVTDIRLAFYGKLYNEDKSIAVNHNFSLFLKRQLKENDPSQRDIKGHKFMYIDRFGNTTWEVKDIQPIVGRKFDYNNCHIAFDGEPELIDLMIAANADVDKQIWDYNESTRTYSLKNKDLTLGEMYLTKDEISNLWKGNLNDIINYFKGAVTTKQAIKLAVGTKDNSQYPVTYVRGFISNRSNFANAIKRYDSLIKNSCSSKEHYVMGALRLLDSNNSVTPDNNTIPTSNDDLPNAPIASINNTTDDEMPF